MKYTIEGFSQEHILTLSYTEQLKDGKEKTVKPEWIDLGLLRYFVDFYPNMKKVEIDGKQYAWLAYSKVLEDLPFIDLNKRSIALHFTKLCKLGLLEQKVFGQGQTVFCFGPKYAGMIDSRYAAKISAADVKFQQASDNILTEPADNILTPINILNNNTIINNRKKEKEINKENFSRSETTGNTELSASLKEVERITPTPIRDICLLHIQNFTTDTEIQNLLIDYLDSRLQQTNNNLTEVSFKAALGTLSVAQQYCEVPNLLKNYTKEVILNATAGAYSQFKSIQTNRYKKSYYNSETQHRVKSAPFGDVSNYDPAGPDLELATDETGNPIKF